MKATRITNPLTFVLCFALTAVFAVPALAQDVDADPKNVTIGKPEYSPYLTKGYPDRVFFGDTHNHCVYQKLKLGRSGDEVRLGWQVT